MTNSATGAPLDGVEVRIGTLADTTGADGRFELNDVTPGAATIQCTATGFEPAETDATVSSTGLAIDFIFSRTELFEYSVFALYVPATVTVRGILLTLGGLTPGRS